MQENRRGFLNKVVSTAAMVGVGGSTLIKSGSLKAAIAEGQGSVDGAAGWGQMDYRVLGRTGYKASRLVFGCGASLSRKPKDRLLNVAFDSGINVFDVGTGRYYGDAEKNLAGFLKDKAIRDNILLISKGMVSLDVGPHDAISVAQAKQAATTWTTIMEESLRDLAVEHIDAYYLMASNNPNVVGSEEMYKAFETAKQAGKVKYLGLSTHQNAQAVLEKAIETGWYDLAMLAITPGGWYDWDGKSILAGSPPMKDLQPLLAKAKAAGIGLVGMKAARHLSGRSWFGFGEEDAFDEHYDPVYLKAKMSAFQRSYAYVLGHGMDVVNSDIQNFLHLRENFEAAVNSGQYFGNIA